MSQFEQKGGVYASIQGISASDHGGTDHEVEASHNNENGIVGLVVDDGLILSTETFVLSGNLTNHTLLTPSDGKKLCIRRISVHANGNVNTCDFKFPTSNKIALRFYGSAQVRDNIELGHFLGATDESLTFTGNTGVNEIFVCISYIEQD